MAQKNCFYQERGAVPQREWKQDDTDGRRRQALVRRPGIGHVP